VIGDWNDDLDKSIYNNQTSPFRQFANDTSNFFFASEILTDAGEQSTVYYSNMIDHICVSKNTKNGFISDTDIDVFRLDNYISSYGSSTSDHYPVYCKFYPSKWHSKNSSSLQLISNSPDIFWDGRNLVVPFKHKELKYFNMQGQTLKSDGLPSNQLIVYQLNSGNKRYTGKFVINQ